MVDQDGSVRRSYAQIIQEPDLPAQVSRRVTVRLNTGLPDAWALRSATKKPSRSNCN